MKVSLAVLAASVAVVAASRPKTNLRTFSLRKEDDLQTNVTWDKYSFMINGQRQAIFSGEFHPYRLPVHDLYLDVFQKIKSAGFTAVSFYTFWGLHEPKRGAGIDFSGFRDVEPFIQAAQQAGLYLIARPGPYVNAETTGGGFPGWGARDPGLWRTSNASFVEAYHDYVSAIGQLLAKYQLSNGGPIILVQVENEYTGWASGYSEDYKYEDELKAAFRAAGITVPLTVNDAYPGGHFTDVDIYGYDAYPNGFDCSNPGAWPVNAFPTWTYNADRTYTPNAPNANFEFQGGAFDPWGGTGYENCAILTGADFERVFYKNRFASATTLLNLYMIYGGTNFGGIAHPGVYTSYDYGSAIAEDRTLREKYYELKLQAHFYTRSAAWLTSRPTNVGAEAGAFTGNEALAVTQTRDMIGNATAFYTIAHVDSSSDTVVSYQLHVPSSKGDLTLPLLGGDLVLNGKDSKITVVDYTAGSTKLLYSTGEIATWATIDNRDVFVLYGNAGETLETAFLFNGTAPTVTVVSGAHKPKTGTKNGALALQYTTTGSTVVAVGSSILLYIVDRANAYEFWTLYPSTSGPYALYGIANPVIVKGGYLLRNVTLSNGTVALTGDLNATASFEVLAPSSSAQKVTFNGQMVSTHKTAYDSLVGSVGASLPAVKIPNLRSLTWKSADSLPEISSSYSDAAWPAADHMTTNNSMQPSTPVVLYASDYGFHTGNILWRSHFTATGAESAFNVTVIGGSAFGYSVWLDGTFLGSFVGDAVSAQADKSFGFKRLEKGRKYVVTILQDHMGLEEDWAAAGDQFKTPRGILAYSFPGSNGTRISAWKVTGNLGGEDYVDRTRGPLNEGGLYGERQGWHLPGFDDSRWPTGEPTDGFSNAGVRFYRTAFALDIPSGVDYPLAIVLANATTANPHFRAKIYVNGYQFGRYVNALGPQTSFLVPQGVLNYQGNNTLALALWAQDAHGAKIGGIHLEVRGKAQSTIGQIANLPFDAWTKRPGAY